MIDIASIATESDLGQLLDRCAVDNDPLQAAPELVTKFWIPDGAHRPIARFLRGSPNSGTIITAHMGDLELHEQDPQNFWFHTLRDKLSGNVSATRIASWIHYYLFPTAIAPEPIAAVRARYPHLGASEAWLPILLHWSIIDTDPLSRAPESIQQSWKRMWMVEPAPEACYLRGIVGVANIVANQDGQLTLFQYDPQHGVLEDRGSLQLYDDRTTAEIHQWVCARWQQPTPTR